MTRPEEAPDTQVPAEPILQSKSLRAMGPSVAINVSTDSIIHRVPRGLDERIQPGRPSCRQIR